MGNTNINLDEELKTKAKQAGINISNLTERAIKDKLNVKEFQVSDNLICHECKRPGRQETIDDVRMANRKAANENDHDRPLNHSKKDLLTWIYPGEYWICNSCLRTKLSMVSVAKK